MLNYTSEPNGVIVVAKDSPITSPGELRGKTIAIPDRFTVISIMGLEFLRGQGLDPDMDTNLFTAGSHNNAAIAVERGEAQAAIIGSVPYKQLTEELRLRLRVVASTVAIPSQFNMATPELNVPQIERIKAALLSFTDTPEGKKFMEAKGFGGLHPTAEQVLKQRRRYLRKS